MPKVKFTEADLKDSKLEPGWRLLDVKSVSDWKPGKKDPTSLTIECLFVVSEGKDAGTPIKHWFTEKQMNYLGRYIKCFVATPVAGKEYEASETVGKKVQGYCENDISTGFNVVKDFRPVGR
jgi:hypothetical protein